MTQTKPATHRRRQLVRGKLCVSGLKFVRGMRGHFVRTGQAHAIQRRIDKFQKQFPRPARAPRKVVYGYSDAYLFSRIVMSDDLVFDSHFESGNLQQASRIKTMNGSMEYELVLSPDPSKKAHVQW